MSSIDVPAAATLEDFVLTNNYAEGHGVNYFTNFAGTVNSFHHAYNINGRSETSSSSAVIDGLGQSYDRLRFMHDNITAASGQVAMQNAFGSTTRGYVVTKDGWIKRMSARISEAVTAQSITMRVFVNGVEAATYQIQFTDATLFKTTQVSWNSTQAVVAGNVITATIQGNGALLPNGTIDTDLIVEVGY